MRSIDLAVIAGDGIGPEVTDAATVVLSAAAKRFGFNLSLTEFDLGADRFLRTGAALDEESVDALRQHDAILLGAVGDPRVEPGVLERGLILRLRTTFHQAVNIRPVRLYPGVRSPIVGLTPQRCDVVIIRENTEGLYAGGGSTVHPGTPMAVAIQNSVTTAGATAATVEFAFRLAERRRRKLALCHKTNILVHAGTLWAGTVERIGRAFPDVELDYVHVDAMCQHLVLTPERFDVVVTDNLFGDIISDLGATVLGGLGLAASANLNPSGDAPSMFEPIHGSAPDIAGRGWANPVAAVLSAAMCLASLGEVEAALACEDAATSVLRELPAYAGPGMGATTTELGYRIAAVVGEAPVSVSNRGPSLLVALGALASPRHGRSTGEPQAAFEG